MVVGIELINNEILVNLLTGRLAKMSFCAWPLNTAMRFPESLREEKSCCDLNDLVPPHKPLDQLSLNAAR